MLREELGRVGTRAYLALGHKDGDGMVLATGSEGKGGSTLYAKLVPDRDEVMGFIELDLVGDETSTVLLIGSVLEVPTTLLLLDKAANGLLLSGSDAVFDSSPNLEVLGSVTGLILARSLPGDDERAVGRESQFVDVQNGKCKDVGSGRGIDDGNSFG